MTERNLPFACIFGYLINKCWALVWNSKEKTPDPKQNEFVSGYVSRPHVEHERHTFFCNFFP